MARENVVPDRQWPKKHPSGQQTRGQITRLFVATACIAALDTNTLTTADPITRALLAESVRETLERRLAAERPYGTYDDSAQDTTHLAGESSRTTTTATTTSREPPSARPTQAS